ncbi:MAG: ThuA domain-containing protein, partial [Planctomycetota bacterium]|nr:ThuA domain-containing protein [Planctomycetota bacterium]
MALLPAFALGLLSLPLAAHEGDPKVLVVSGANNHDWEWTTPSLASILRASGRFEVSVTREPGKTLADQDALQALDAVVLDYNGPRWGEAAESAFLEAVRAGLGVVVIHAADNHGNGWPEYEKLVADLWRKGTGHGRFHPFDVDVIDRDHPVTRSLPTILQHPDELYHNLVNVHGVERRVLATALSSKESGGTGEAEPMILVRSYGQGRMFHTPLGHVWKN